MRAIAMALAAACLASNASAATPADPIVDINRACATQRAAVAKFARERGGDDSFLDRYLTNIANMPREDLTKRKASPPPATAEHPQQEIDFVMCAISRRLDQLPK
ncbi:hypothetical protein [Roseiterribacter gracilis]|uniref:Uncharacterized protein n=1 Tax=Roseiterribacter gracilis TaxID=2812848 RepID=A0A8S8XBV6_9PROT|nr:hypothetical protein TMPK1_15480 [Rhodospirillales bacterium TMPK1]